MEQPLAYALSTRSAFVTHIHHTHSYRDGVITMVRQESRVTVLMATINEPLHTCTCQITDMTHVCNPASARRCFFLVFSFQLIINYIMVTIQ